MSLSDHCPNASDVNTHAPSLNISHRMNQSVWGTNYFEDGGVVHIAVSASTSNRQEEQKIAVWSLTMNI